MLCVTVSIYMIYLTAEGHKTGIECLVLTHENNNIVCLRCINCDMYVCLKLGVKVLYSPPSVGNGIGMRLYM